MFRDKVVVTPKRRIVREKGKKMQILEFELPETDNAMFYRAMGLQSAKTGGWESAPLTKDHDARIDEFLDNELFPHLAQTIKNAGKNEALDETIPIIKKAEKELKDTNALIKFSYKVPGSKEPVKVQSASALLAELQGGQSLDPETHFLEYQKENGEKGYKALAEFDPNKSTFNTKLSSTPGDKIFVYRSIGGKIDFSGRIEIKKPFIKEKSAKKAGGGARPPPPSNTNVMPTTPKKQNKPGKKKKGTPKRKK